MARHLMLRTARRKHIINRWDLWVCRLLNWWTGHTTSSPSFQQRNRRLMSAKALILHATPKSKRKKIYVTIIHLQSRSSHWKHLKFSVHQFYFKNCPDVDPEVILDSSIVWNRKKTKQIHWNSYVGTKMNIPSGLFWVSSCRRQLLLLMNGQLLLGKAENLVPVTKWDFLEFRVLNLSIALQCTL